MPIYMYICINININKVIYTYTRTYICIHIHVHRNMLPKKALILSVVFSNTDKGVRDREREFVYEGFR